MTSLLAASGRPDLPLIELTYAPGACNIGPAEIARRRRSGHLALAVAAALAVALVAIDASPEVRLLIGLPAAGAASGYLQAWLRFCAAYGFRGIFNFGPLGRPEVVSDREAARRDRRRALEIATASMLVGLIAGTLFALLPL